MGWRIINDWVEAQLAIIETDMVSLDQVFLPYMSVEPNRSLYQVIAANYLALPGPSPFTDPRRDPAQ